VVAEGREPPTLDALRTHAAAKLPAYMVPSTFTLLPTLPLTPNGKVDRKALPDPEPIRPEVAAAFVAPRNELERAIAAIWCDVLQLDRVGVDDNFFDVGGHSLLLVEVRARLDEKLGHDVPIVAMFEHPTIRSLVSHLTREEEPRSVDEARERARTRRAALARRTRAVREARVPAG
jgi:hypothetical protein